MITLIRSFHIGLSHPKWPVNFACSDQTLANIILSDLFYDADYNLYLLSVG
jgi:hypothetical protein